jgi:hypothetical protein
LIISNFIWLQLSADGYKLPAQQQALGLIRITTVQRFQMLRDFIKFLSIALINLLVLTVLLLLWTDEFELAFNEGVRAVEFLKTLGFTVASFGAAHLVLLLLKKRRVTEISVKIKIATLVTFLASSYLYVDYLSKIVNNRFANHQLRKSIIRKVQPANQMAYGTKADSLSFKEYQVIAGKRGFPKLPDAAMNISYIDAYDGFLPDYYFSMAYEVPKEMRADTFSLEKGDFIRQQSIEDLDSTKRVTYSEILH